MGGKGRVFNIHPLAVANKNIVFGKLFVYNKGIWHIVLLYLVVNPHYNSYSFYVISTSIGHLYTIVLFFLV